MENLKNMVDDFKKVFRNFGRENRHFFLKKRNSEILVCEIFISLSKLGARSPPMGHPQINFAIGAEQRIGLQDDYDREIVQNSQTYCLCILKLLGSPFAVQI